jgi:hypothetical protein
MTDWMAVLAGLTVTAATFAALVVHSRAQR